MMKLFNYFFIFFATFLGICSCQQNKPVDLSYVKIQGFAQGTTWHISYKSFNNENLEKQVDSILRVFDNSLSAYNSISQLTKINNNDTSVIVDKYFKNILEESKFLYNLSNHAFDPTISPLVSAWGFSKHTNLHVPSQKEIDSILQFVGLDKVSIVDNKVVKTDPRISFSFNANAQGYSVDVVCDWFKENGYTDYLVEIGGETRSCGLNSIGEPWRVGIERPIDGVTENDRVIQTVVPLSGKSLCTSGNYRNYFIEDGIKYSHELDPNTGYPKRDSLLSVAIVANTAVFADGLATAVMVLGLDKGYSLVDSLPDTEGYFIYAKSNGKFDIISTKGFQTVE
ncbi:MAG: FAD:protein FMN transferase [Bacteroidales bacterium]|nr:FAD:protein FMN transferase [Bacteroidales bacterium]